MKKKKTKKEEEGEGEGGGRRSIGNNGNLNYFQ